MYGPRARYGAAEGRPHLSQQRADGPGQDDHGQHDGQCVVHGVGGLGGETGRSGAALRVRQGVHATSSTGKLTKDMQWTAAPRGRLGLTYTARQKSNAAAAARMPYLSAARHSPRTCASPRWGTGGRWRARWSRNRRRSCRTARPRSRARTGPRCSWSTGPTQPEPVCCTRGGGGGLHSMISIMEMVDATRGGHIEHEEGRTCVR